MNKRQKVKTMAQPVKIHDQAIQLMKAYKALVGKKPTAAMRSSTDRFPTTGNPANPVDYNPKGMGDVVKGKSSSKWARGPAEARPSAKSQTAAVPYYDVKGGLGDVTNTMTPRSTKVPSASMRSTLARMEEPRRPLDIKKKSFSVSFCLPEDKTPSTVYYDVKGGVGDATKASSWARSTTNRLYVIGTAVLYWMVSQCHPDPPGDHGHRNERQTPSC